jgi:hypothetical protein
MVRPSYAVHIGAIQQHKSQVVFAKKNAAIMQLSFKHYPAIPLLFILFIGKRRRTLTFLLGNTL